MTAKQEEEGGSVKLYLKKIFDFDSEIAIQAIENSEEGKDKKM